MSSFNDEITQRLNAIKALNKAALDCTDFESDHLTSGHSVVVPEIRGLSFGQARTLAKCLSSVIGDFRQGIEMELCRDMELYLERRKAK